MHDEKVLEAAVAKSSWRGFRWFALFTVILVGLMVYGAVQPRYFPTCSDASRHVISLFLESGHPMADNGQEMSVGKLRQWCVDGNWSLDARRDAMETDSRLQAESVLSTVGVTFSDHVRPRGASCRTQSRDGVCIKVYACDGISVPGVCPGDEGVQCCILGGSK